MSTTAGLHYRTQHKWDLSPRQREVLGLIARGYTNAQIGEALGMTLDGAKFHVSEIIGKLGVSNREEAAAWWREYNRPVARLARLVAPLTSLGVWRVAGAAGAVTAVGAVAVVAIAVARSGGETSPSEAAAAADEADVVAPFQSGAFVRQVGQDVYALEMRDDGTFSLVAGSAIFEGSYQLDGDRITIDDRAFGSACFPETEPGVYGWEQSAGGLVFTKVDEPCDMRGRFWARAWQPR